MSISSLSDYDYGLLKATFTNHNDKNFQCRYKESLFKGRPDHEFIVRDERKRKGCLVFSDRYYIEIDGAVEFNSCLCHPNYQHPMYSDYWELYANFNKHGILPFDGCYMDQPAQVIEAIKYIESMVAEKEYKDQLEASQKGN